MSPLNHFKNDSQSYIDRNHVCPIKKRICDNFPNEATLHQRPNDIEVSCNSLWTLYGLQQLPKTTPHGQLKKKRNDKRKTTQREN